MCGRCRTKVVWLGLDSEVRWGEKWWNGKLNKLQMKIYLK